MATARANRLAGETSPYLLQHAHNPVDWYPWGPEAIARAKAEDRPILLSIGYAACHWCHVMERESFEDEATAALMNEHFVCIKVDREERPDLDAIYMDAAQAMTGSGGWPLTAFLTPDGEPFFAGTYFPPGAAARAAVVPAGAGRDRRGVDRAARRGRDAGREDRRAHRAGRAAERLRGAADGRDHARRVLATAAKRSTTERGGFGGAPKFPQPMTLEFALRCAVRGWEPALADRRDHARPHGRRRDLRPPRRRVRTGTRRTRRGTCRTSRRCSTTTPSWRGCTRGRGRSRATTGTGAWRRRRSSTCSARCSTPRAGSSRRRTPTAKASKGSSSCGDGTSWSRSSGRRWRHVSVPRRTATGKGRTSCGGHGRSRTSPRSRVCRPTSWRPRWRTPDGCCSRSAKGGCIRPRTTRSSPRGTRSRSARSPRPGRAFGEPSYVEEAVRCAEFVLTHLRDERGRLLRSWRNGTAGRPGFADDYAIMAAACLTLYETTFELRWFEEAVTLADELLRLFHDDERGGFFQTGSDAEELVLRPKELYDNATPSGNSVAAETLLRLASFTGDAEYERAGLSGAPPDPRRDGGGADRVRTGALRARPLPGAVERGRDHRRSRGGRHARARGGGDERGLSAQHRVGGGCARRSSAAVEPSRYSVTGSHGTDERPPTSASGSRASSP